MTISESLQKAPIAKHVESAGHPTGINATCRGSGGPFADPVKPNETDLVSG
jgi:hypothetical protein